MEYKNCKFLNVLYPYYRSNSTNQRAQEHRIRDIDTESRSLEDEKDELVREGNLIRNSIGNAKGRLANMESQDGKNVSKLRALGRETAEAWEWITNNRDKFKEEVFGPPLITCKLKDPRFANQLESFLQRGHFLTITTMNGKDFSTLSNALSSLRLADVQYQVARGGVPHTRPMSTEQLQQLNLDGWAIDYLEGPDRVLGMLCNVAQLDRTALGVRDINEAEYHAILQTPLSKVAAGGTQYNVFRRKEYGDSATSATTKTFPPARILTDAPVDTSEKTRVEEEIAQLEARFELLRPKVGPVREKLAQLAEEKSNVNRELVRKSFHIVAFILTSPRNP